MKKLLFTLLAAIPGAVLFAQNTGVGTIIPTDQLHTTGTVRFENYRGAGTRIMQIDSSGRMLITGAGPVFSTTPAAAIPDNGCGAGSGVSSAITISGLPATILSSKIAVRINVTHTFDADLRVLLVSPGSSYTLTLAYAAGGSGNNFTSTVFSDAASNSLASGTAPFTGTFKPSGALFGSCTLTPNVATFGAMGGGSINPNGTWTIKVYDNGAGNTGTLNKWDISFSGGESFTTAEQNNFIPKLSAGNLVPSALYQSAATGNVGLNTANPSYPFTVNASGNGIVQSDNLNSVDVGLFTNASGGWLQTNTNHPLLFATAGSGAQMELGTGGNLGIGLTGATYRLHIMAAGNTLFEMDNTTPMATGVTNDVVFKTGAYYSGMIRTRGTGSINAALGFYTNTNPTIGSLVERLTIADNGYVGIGNLIPAYNLDVSGLLHTTGSATIGGALSATSLSSGGTISAVGNISSSGTVSGNVVSTPLVIGTNVNVGSGGLSVVGPVTLGNGAPAINRVLTASNTTGNAAWHASSINSGFQGALAAGQTLNTAGNAQNVVAYVTTGGYDDGPNWDNNTHEFVAPEAGVYHFDATVLFDYMYSPTGYSIVQMYFNRAATSTLFSKTNEDITQSVTPGALSQSATLKLNAGDRISCTIIYTVNCGTMGLLSSSSISGYRVY